MRTGRVSVLRILERLCMTLGSVCLLVAAAAYLDSWVGSRLASAAFASTVPTALAEGAPATPTNGSPVGVLRIARLELEVPVLFGTDRRTLNRGAGVVEGSDLPGESGHVVISAHRDSFFRLLEKIREGDVVELQSMQTVQRYQVKSTFITDPLDLSVLDDPGAAALTLITCYPFRYVGFAPDRFIVRAVLITSRSLR